MLKDYVVVANIFVRTLLLWSSYVEGLCCCGQFIFKDFVVVVKLC
jgi:hypothetical protein